MMGKRWLAALCAAGTMALASQADAVILNPTQIGIVVSQPGFGLIDSSLLATGGSTADFGVMKFDVSGLLSPVQDAHLFVDDFLGGPDAMFGVFSVLSDWDTSVHTFKPIPTYAVNPLSTGIISGSGQTLFSFDVTEAINSWIADPSSNHGLALVYLGSGYSGHTIVGENQLSSSVSYCCAPSLVIDFDRANIPGDLSVPEPTTWALMILGFGFAGAGLRRARSRCRSGADGLQAALS